MLRVAGIARPRSEAFKPVRYGRGIAACDAIVLDLPAAVLTLPQADVFVAMAWASDDVYFRGNSAGGALPWST